MAVGKTTQYESILCSLKSQVYSYITHTHNFFMALDFVRDNQAEPVQEHSPTYTYRGHQSSHICFIHLLRSMASSLFNSNARQSFSTISLQVFFGLPLGLAPSTSYSIHHTYVYKKSQQSLTNEDLRAIADLRFHRQPACSDVSQVHRSLMVAAASTLCPARSLPS